MMGFKANSSEKKRKAPEQVPQGGDEAPMEKKIKIVDGIAIPKPPPIKKAEKKRHLPAKVIRAQQRQQANEEARKNAIEKRKKEIAEGTFDWEAEELRRKTRQLNRMVKAEIAKRERAGEFGVVLPHPSVMLKMEKEAHARGEPFIHPSKLGFDIPADTPFENCKKVSYKAEKYKREKLKREAKRDVKGRLRAEMFGEEYIPESALTPEEKKQRRQQEKDQRRAERRAIREAKALAELKMEEELEKKRELTRDEAKEKNVGDEWHLEQNVEIEGVKVTSSVAVAMEEDSDLNGESEEADEILIKPDSSAGVDFETCADEIKLGVNVAGRVKKVPGRGRVDKYPTKAEKKQRKLSAQAAAAGITLEEYKAKLEKEKEEADAPKKEQLAELRAERGGLLARQWNRYRRMAEEEGQEKAEQFFIKCVQQNKAREEAKANGITVEKPKPEAPLLVLGTDTADSKRVVNGHNNSQNEASDSKAEKKKLSKKKAEKYSAKAAAKGMTVEEYIERHEFKKAKIAARQVTKSIKSSGVQVMEDTVHVSVVPAKAPTTKAVKTPKNFTAAVKGAKHAHQPGGFIIDTTGDATLNKNKTSTAETHFVVDASGDPDLKNGPSKIIWHPDMLGDRRVKDLTKAEREARLEWMREQRAAKAAALGKRGPSKKEKHRRRVEMKMQQRNRLVYEIMREKDKPREEVSKDELLDARRKAKRIQRELKREKRNKVIFRKKLGGGLRGKLGAKISQGGEPRYDLVKLGPGGMAPMG